METDRLVSHHHERGASSSPSPHYHQFLVLAVGFGVTNALVIVTLAYATSLHSLRLGSFSMGSFYASYSAGSLILGAAAVERFGADRVIKGSMIAMLCYLVVFTATASSQLPADGIVMWSLSLAGSIVGGAALGLGFSAQGVYFLATALSHSKHTGVASNEAIDAFAGIFAAIFIGAQCGFYLLQSLLIYVAGLSEMGTFLVFTLGTAIVTAATLYWLEPLPSDRDRRSRRRRRRSSSSSTGTSTGTGTGTALVDRSGDDNPQGGGDDDDDEEEEEEEADGEDGDSEGCRSFSSQLVMTLKLALWDARGLYLAPISISYGFLLVFMYSCTFVAVSSCFTFLAFVEKSR